MEVFCLTQQKKSIILPILGWLCLFLAIASLILFGGTGSLIIALGIPVFGFLFWFLVFNSDIEYECSYFDGEFRFARIRSKSSRKALPTYTSEELVTMAPAGDHTLYRYENDKSVKVIDYSSKVKGAPYYVMIFKTQNDTRLVKVEVDKEYLDAVSQKNGFKVIRRKENA